MRIVHVISSLDLGGAENFCAQLANCQSKSQDVEMITLRPNNPDNTLKSILKPQISLHELAWKKKYSLAQLFSLRSLIKKINPDVVHVHLHNAYYYVFGVSSFMRRCRFVHTIHSNIDVWEPVLEISNRLRLINNKIIHVCISASIYKQMQRQFPKLKSVAINNGIEPVTVGRTPGEIRDFWNAYFPGKAGRLCFLAIGNIARFKNYALLAEVFKALEKELPGIFCVIIGKAADLAEVEKIKRIGAGNVFMAGQHQQAPDFLSQADALVISSTQEGMPLVALEALSLGIPLISTPAGGMKDILQDNYNGFISRDFEMLNLKKSILDFVNANAEDRKRLSHNARQSFKAHYELSHIHRQYLNLYKNGLAAEK